MQAATQCDGRFKGRTEDREEKDEYFLHASLGWPSHQHSHVGHSCSVCMQK